MARSLARQRRTTTAALPEWIAPQLTQLVDDLDLLPDHIDDPEKFCEYLTGKISTSVSRSRWTSPASSCPPMLTTFGNFSAESAPTPDSRIS
jgi:hypothetical protein